MIRSGSSSNVQLVQISVDTSSLTDNSFSLYNIWYIANANAQTAFMKEMTMFWFTFNSVTQKGIERIFLEISQFSFS